MEHRVYVGTYAKYNNGSIAGKWLDLADYTDNEEFYEACKELHSDESDPEFMFQAWEGISSRFINRLGIEIGYWDWVEIVEASHYGDEVFNAAADLDIDADMVEELYCGEHDSDIAFAQDMAEQTGLIDETLAWPHNCIDWERAARDLMYDYGDSNGHYFRTSYQELS